MTHDLGVIAALLTGVDPTETKKVEREQLLDAVSWPQVRA